MPRMESLGKPEHAMWHVLQKEEAHLARSSLVPAVNVGAFEHKIVLAEGK